LIGTEVTIGYKKMGIYMSQMRGYPLNSLMRGYPLNHRPLIRTFFFASVIMILSGNLASAQKFVEKLDQALQIPSVITLKATPFHLYALSEKEGLIVFRQRNGSLQWLYSSSGMQSRGSELDVDARFAYIYGNGRRLGIIEPTSVLGVYSSTTLPAAPRRVARTGQMLWLALGEAGLGSISLSTPEAVDQDVNFPFEELLRGHNVLETVSEPSSSLFILSQNFEEESTSFENSVESNHWLHRFSVVNSDSLRADQSWALPPLTGSSAPARLHLVEGNLYLSNSIGEFFRVLLSDDEQQLTLEYVTSFGHEIDFVGQFDKDFYIRSRNGNIWVGNVEEGFSLARQDAEAGNYLAVSHHGVYLSQYDRITPLQILIDTQESEKSTQERSGSIDSDEELSGESINQDEKQPEIGTSGPRSQSANGQNNALIPVLASISDQIYPLGATIILPIEQEDPIPADRINFTLLNPVSGASIRGQSFYWKPSSNQVGRTLFTLLATSTTGATDTTSFAVDIRPFNAPPLFAPTRPFSIPVGEPFETQFRATDPDGEPTTLIRYLGVDLPTGVQLNEQTGLFKWTPEVRQVGTHRFRIVATDQYGAAATSQVEIQVVDL